MSDTFEDMRAIKEAMMAEMKMKLGEIPLEELRAELVDSEYEDEAIDAAIGVFSNPPALEAIASAWSESRHQPEVLLEQLTQVIATHLDRVAAAGIDESTGPAVAEVVAARIVEALA